MAVSQVGQCMKPVSETELARQDILRNKQIEFSKKIVRTDVRKPTDVMKKIKFVGSAPPVATLR